MFVCDVSDQELVAMRVDVEWRRKLSEDGVTVVDRTRDPSRFVFIGLHEELPGDDAVIV